MSKWSKILLLSALFLIATLLIFVFIILRHSNWNDAPIIGKWQLMYIRYEKSSGVLNLSARDKLVYEFAEDGTIRVTPDFGVKPGSWRTIRTGSYNQVYECDIMLIGKPLSGPNTIDRVNQHEFLIMTKDIANTSITYFFSDDPGNFSMPKKTHYIDKWEDIEAYYYYNDLFEEEQ